MVRDYGQYCGIASALDIFGGRWTLLILREVLIAPRRYKDLLANLPGIGTNLLVDRLRMLESQGLLRKTRLPPPADADVYVPTEKSRTLEPTLLELARWGVRYVPDPDVSHYDPGWLVLSLRALFDPKAAHGKRLLIRFQIDETVVDARVRGSRIETGFGPDGEADLVWHSDAATLLEVNADPSKVTKAQKDGRLTLEGDTGLLGTVFAIFSGAGAKDLGSA